MISKDVFEVGGKTVGDGFPCFVIAEAGVNHNGDVQRARELIAAAAVAGADAVKFQTFNADLLVTRNAQRAKYQVNNMGGEESQHDMLKRLELSHDDHKLLKKYADERGILFLSTPFDEESADFLLEELKVSAFKVSSGDLTNHPFLRYLATMGKPLILSTGMSDLSEVRQAVDAIQSEERVTLALLHCVSVYPTPAHQVNLRAMSTLKQQFGVPVGYSDHTMGREIATAAVAMGACVIEKHFTLSRELPGPDHRASLEPEELLLMMQEIRNVSAALGDGQKVPGVDELDTARLARKSLVAAGEIPAGTVLQATHMAIRRPGSGLRPDQKDELIGKIANDTIEEGTVLDQSMFQ